MDIIVVLFKQNLIMVLYLLIGYFLFKKKLLTNQGSTDIGRLLLYIVMPIAIIKSYITEFSIDRLIGLVISFIAALLSLIVSVGISKIVFGKNQKIEHFGAAFSNAGFIGIPLVQMTLGQEAVFYVSSFVAILNILQWTYGVLIITDEKECISIKKIRTNPIVNSFIVGIFLFVVSIKLPASLLGMLGTVASMNGPLAMIVLGAYLAQISIKEMFNEIFVYKCAFVRLILIPLATIALLSVIPKEYVIIKLAILIAASAPVGSNVAIFAQIYQKDYKQAVKIVCLSTVLCIVTMPIMIGIANYIW